jgi:hypothetical protein
MALQEMVRMAGGIHEVRPFIIRQQILMLELRCHLQHLKVITNNDAGLIFYMRHASTALSCL